MEVNSIKSLAVFALFLSAFMVFDVNAGAFFETGSQQLNTTIDNSGWVTVATQKTYVNPVVIAGPLTHNNNNSLSVRVRNASGNSFDIGMQSPCESTGSSAGSVTCPTTWIAEEVNWLVIEKGTWIFPDGTKIEAYLHETDTMRSKFGGNANGGDSITYSHTYASAPVVLHTVNSFEDPEWITSTVYGPGPKNSPPTNAGFTLALEGAEAVSSHAEDELIGWVAIEQASGNNNSVPYSAFRTGGRDVDRHDDECQALGYGQTFSGTPNLLAHHNTMGGRDGGWARLCGSGLETAQFNVHIDEDQVNDAERQGQTEYAAWFAFEADSFGALEFLSSTKTFADEDGDGFIGPGELVTFTISITNLQDDFDQENNAQDEFLDVLDSNFVYVAEVSSGGGILTNSGQNVSWNGAIAASAVENFSYQVRVADSSTVCTLANISNQATLSMDPIDDSIAVGDVDNLNIIDELTDDPNVDDGNDSDMDSFDSSVTDDDDPTLVPVSCLSDVSVTKNDANTSYTPGTDSEYTITIANDGPHNLIGAMISDILPANVVVDGNWTCDPAVAPGDGTASCVSGSVAGTTQTGSSDISLTVDIPSGTSLVITVPVIYSAIP